MVSGHFIPVVQVTLRLQLTYARTHTLLHGKQTRTPVAPFHNKPNCSYYYFSASPWKELCRRPRAEH